MPQVCSTYVQRIANSITLPDVSPNSYTTIRQSGNMIQLPVDSLNSGLNIVPADCAAKAINMEGLRQVNHQRINDLNELEAMYNKTVGAIFTPYITSAPIYFTWPDIDGEPECTEVDSENFSTLLKYALYNRTK